MKSFPRGFAVFIAAVVAFMASGSTAGARNAHSNSRESAKLPFTVNLAPGDVLVHGTDRGLNGTDQYQQHPMEVGDQVIGSIGKMRSVILTGDASAVEVMPGSAITAENRGGIAYLNLNSGTTRVGRASYGDGTPIRLLIRTHQVGAVIHGGDLIVSKGTSVVSTVVKPEADGRYLFSGRVSLVPLSAANSTTVTVVRPEPSFSYLNLSLVATPPVAAPVAVNGMGSHHGHFHHHHHHHHGWHHHHRSSHHHRHGG